MAIEAIKTVSTIIEHSTYIVCQAVEGREGREGCDLPPHPLIQPVRGRVRELKCCDCFA